jgi:hypothetical protein
MHTVILLREIATIDSDAHRRHHRPPDCERDKLNVAIEALQGRSAPKKPAAVETNIVAPGSPKKRHVSAAARRKMAAAQKKRWAAIKGAKQA